MKEFVSAWVVLALAVSQGAAMQPMTLPAITTMLQVGAVPIADTGPGGFQDPFAQAAKKVVYGKLDLAGGVTLEWDKRDYAVSSPSALATREKMGSGIHDMTTVLKNSGPDAWVVLRDKNTGSRYFVFSRDDGNGGTLFPQAKIDGAKDPRVIDGKLWLTFPGEKAGSYQLARLVPDPKNPIDRSFSFTEGRLDGKVSVDNATELGLLLEQPAFADALRSMGTAKLNADTNYVDGLKGFVSGKTESLSLSQGADGTLTVGLIKEGKPAYEITANKDGAQLAAVGQ